MANADSTSSTPLARKGRGNSTQIEIDTSHVTAHLYASLDNLFDIRALGNSAATILEGEIESGDQETLGRLVNLMLGSIGKTIESLRGADLAVHAMKGGAA